MTGSPAVATWIAQIVFWALIGVGVLTDSLGVRASSMFVALWLFGFAVISRVAGLFLGPYMAVLDIALVLVVFKGDVRLS